MKNTEHYTITFDAIRNIKLNWRLIFGILFVWLDIRLRHVHFQTAHIWLKKCSRLTETQAEVRNSWNSPESAAHKAVPNVCNHTKGSKTRFFVQNGFILTGFDGWMNWPAHASVKQLGFCSEINLPYASVWLSSTVIIIQFGLYIVLGKMLNSLSSKILFSTE